MDADKYKTVAAAVAVAVTAIVNDSSSSEDDDNGSAGTVPKRKLPKSRQYFAQVDLMDDNEFFTHFRLSRGRSICHPQFSAGLTSSLEMYAYHLMKYCGPVLRSMVTGGHFICLPSLQGACGMSGQNLCSRYMCVSTLFRQK